MDDQQILQALSMLTQAIQGRMGGGGMGGAMGAKGTAVGGLDGFEPDPTNKVKGWSGINLVRGPDTRPKLADKDYVIEKLGLNQGQEMPHDSSGGGYARPF